MSLTRRIYDHIVDQVEYWGQYPSKDDLQRFFASSSDDVGMHLHHLECEGLIKTDAADSRISLVRTLGVVQPIHLLGTQPREVGSTYHALHRSRITLDLREVGMHLEQDSHAIYVADNSMLDAGIKGGDIAILVTTSFASGDIIAVDQDGRTVLRRYLIIKELPYLLAENPGQPDLRCAVGLVSHGVFWGLVRREVGCHPARLTPKKQISYSGEAHAAGRLDDPSILGPLRRPAGQGFSYAQDAFLRCSGEPPMINRISSTPHNDLDSLASRQVKKPESRPKPERKSMKPLGSKAQQPSKRLKSLLPEPPERLGLNEHGRDDYRKPGYSTRRSRDKRGSATPRQEQEIEAAKQQ